MRPAPEGELRRDCEAISQMDAAESISRHHRLPQSFATQEGTGLSDRDQEILAFERQWWQYAGAKEKAIREIFAMSSTRYYQVLNRLIDSEAALRVDPMLIRRLRKTRATRKRTRAARRLGIELP